MISPTSGRSTPSPVEVSAPSAEASVQWGFLRGGAAAPTRALTTREANAGASRAEESGAQQECGQEKNPGSAEDRSGVPEWRRGESNPGPRQDPPQLLRA